MQCSLCLNDFPNLNEDGVCADCSSLVVSCALCHTRALFIGFNEIRSAQTDDRRLVCHTCLEQLPSCGYCRHRFLPETLIAPRVLNKHSCHRCFTARTTTCKVCGESFRTDTELTGHLREAKTCEACFSKAYFLCKICGHIRERKENHKDYNGYSVCVRCAPNSSEVCRVCNEEHHTRVLREYIPFSGDTPHKLCLDCQEIIARPIHNYTYNPSMFKTFGGQLTDCLLGWELEVGNQGLLLKNLKFQNPDIAQIVSERGKGYIYCKSDSSLNGGTGDGFEIVSRPATLDWIKSNLDLLEGILSIRDMGMRSAELPTCGFHVHINKKFFSPIQLYRFLLLFYRNQEFWFYLSQRERIEEIERFSSFEYDPTNLIRSASALKNTKYAPNSHGINKIRMRDRGDAHIRYTAINITSNTVEVRMMRGSLAMSAFLKNLEVVSAAIAFSRKDGSISNVSLEDFMKFIVLNRRTYPHLHLFLKEEYKLSGNLVSSLLVADKISNGDFD